MKSFFILIFFMFFQSLVLAETQVSDELISQLICTTDDELITLVEMGKIETYSTHALLEARSVIQENLNNENWIPQNSIEKSDYCFVTNTLVKKNRDCGNISLTRLQELQQFYCSPLLMTW